MLLELGFGYFIVFLIVMSVNFEGYFNYTIECVINTIFILGNFAIIVCLFLAYFNVVDVDPERGRLMLELIYFIIFIILMISIMWFLGGVYVFGVICISPILLGLTCILTFIYYYGKVKIDIN